MFDAIWADFQQNFWLYISIPFISGIIGYVTKVVAIQMMFAPLEFKRHQADFRLARYRAS